MRTIHKIICVAAMSFFFFSCEKEEKTGYILIQKVFAEFEYKKELESKLRLVQDSRANMLDSLELELKSLIQQIKNAPDNHENITTYEIKRENFLKKREEIEKANKDIIRQYDEQIVKQLNQYVKDYGQKNNYKVIYGSDGSGNIMYADSSLDISGDVIAYINNKYKGYNK